MKREISYLLSVCLIILLLTLTACNSTKQGETEPVGVTPEAPVPNEVDYSALGWTEDEIMLWEERGAASVDSAEAASMLAGFKVVTPGFIPESLHPVSKYMVNDHQAGLRSAGMEPKFEWIDVTLLYAPEGESMPALTFIQSIHKFNEGLGEPVEICGRTVELERTPPEPDAPETKGRVAYGWESNGIWYYLTGTLTDTIDESTLEKVLCSITTD
jgi:hypothetical protein